MKIKHSIYISYHHCQSSALDYWDKRDLEYKQEFEKICEEKFNVVNTKPMKYGKIVDNLSVENRCDLVREDFLRESTVTVVLIGVDTWRQKSVDWEIAASLEETELHTKNGLIGIILPTYKKFLEREIGESHKYKLDAGFGFCNKETIPQRFAMNLENQFAKIYDWSNDTNEIQKWINEAYHRRCEIDPDNSLQMFRFDRMRLVS